ncbi:hypothetical protein [Acetobacter malorum]|uniref:hypothetical protein n=1 Tax=Acetobacter malorum TaxID=178901 RepID=UPI0012E9744D|nr:hypothetical protein [Acetobacter malorum]
MQKKFAFPDRTPLMRPSVVEGKLQRANLAMAFLSATLVASMLLNFFLVFLVLHRADVIPYVSDGSSFGCQVPQIKQSQVK